MVRAHPRSRGENGYLSVFRVTGLGSSPLTRGKPFLYRDPMGRRGLIPAHAGKTGPGRCPPGKTWAHPRSRGENHLLRGQPTPPRGSSPLTRGKPSRQLADLARQRLIPAHAGKTSRARRTSL